MSRAALIVSVLLLCHGQVRAENSVLILAFGGDPGSPLPHAYSYGAPATDAPTYVLRIRTIDEQIEKIFYDTALTISTADRIVQQVNAERAFATLSACEEARAVILAKLSKGLPQAHTSGNPQWQHESEDGSVVGGAVCESPRHFPMPVLRFNISVNR